MSDGTPDLNDFIRNGGRFEPRGKPFNDAAKPDSRAKQNGAKPLVEFHDTSAIFVPLPPVSFLVPGLHVGAGRPGLLGGYGASLKSMAAQDLALAVASGTFVWDHFPSTLGEVRHFDYEQGFRATARRYQRLALGRGLDRCRLGDRLKLAVFPKVYLDSANASDAYALACDGVDLAILDALRGAMPTSDENDSSIRVHLDNLARVSEKTGTAFLVLHHAAKPKDSHSDRRTVLRGSSAIFDACGCILLISPGKRSTSPRKVEQLKPPADAEGAALQEFALEVEDVAIDGNPSAGVRVLWRPAGTDAESPTAVADAKYEADALRLIEAVRANQGSSQNVIIEKSGMGRSRASNLLTALEEEGRVLVQLGERKAKNYRVGTTP